MQTQNQRLQPSHSPLWLVNLPLDCFCCPGSAVGPIWLVARTIPALVFSFEVLQFVDEIAVEVSRTALSSVRPRDAQGLLAGSGTTLGGRISHRDIELFASPTATAAFQLANEACHYLIIGPTPLCYFSIQLHRLHAEDNFSSDELPGRRPERDGPVNLRRVERLLPMAQP
jgi:hypothetical protein